MLPETGNIFPFSCTRWLPAGHMLGKRRRYPEVNVFPVQVCSTYKSSRPAPNSR